MVNRAIETLNNSNMDTKYKFQNKKLSTLAMKYLKNEFSGLPVSNMNESGDYVFSSDYIRNCQFNGCFNEPKTKKLSAYDYNKHYTSCLMGKKCMFGWPVDRPLSVVGLRRKQCPIALTWTAWVQFLPDPTHETCLCCSAKSGLMKLACLDGLYILYLMKLNLLMVILKLVFILLILLIFSRSRAQDGMMQI